MNTVAENLKPPFIAAIMLDAIQAGGDDGPSPSDELVSIAPAQEGFLGLETTCDDQGRWISISYWRDQTCFNEWRKVGSTHVARLFDGLRLELACKFRVSNVDEPLMPSKQLIAPERAIALTTKAYKPDFAAKVFKIFPTIAELFGYEHARGS